MTEKIESIEQQATQTPEESGGEKLFTQAELDRIIGERLARAKSDRHTDEREQALKAREARMDCREYVSGKNYPAELLEILPTADFEQFKSAVDKLAALAGSWGAKGPVNPTVQVDFGAPLGGSSLEKSDSLIANAFKPKR